VEKVEAASPEAVAEVALAPPAGQIVQTMTAAKEVIAAAIAAATLAVVR